MPEIATQTPEKPLSMEDKIHIVRKLLREDKINKSGFERRYRPDLERLDSAYFVFPDKSSCAIRHFTILGRIYELIEFLIDGATDCTLIINFQTQKILEYSRYIDAEVTLVDQMQDDVSKIKGK